MQSKNIGIIILIIVIAIGGFFVFKDKDEKSVEPATQESSSTKPSTTTIPEKTTADSNGYTLAQVATHNDKSSCWSAINGGVYDLTQWISSHPGGEKAILSICGKDGSSAFSGKHGGQEKPEVTLAKFKIGTLTN